MDDLQVFASGLDHPEGVCLAPNGFVYVGGEIGQVYEIGEERIPRIIANTGGFVLGLAADSINRLYLCDIALHCVWRLDQRRQLEVFSKGTQERAMRSPNWGCFDNEGNYYLSDSGDWQQSNGLIWKISNGKTEVWSLESKNFPNGMALSKDCKTLYVIESDPPAFVEFPILENGKAGKRKVIKEFIGIVPDGVTVTTDGRFVIACYRPDLVLLVDKNGVMITLAEDSKGTALAAPTNVAFIGKNLERIIVPNIGRWHVTEFQVADLYGIPLNYPTKAKIGS